MQAHEVKSLLGSLIPKTPEGADLVLDLRELLLSKGHPGKCVRCFFGLLGDLGQPAALLPLRHWLEENLEVEVSATGQEIERMPVKLDQARSLEMFCHKAMETVQMDRAFSYPQITMSLRYKQSA